MELYAENLHFLGDNEKQQSLDCCVHGKVVLKIENEILSNDDSDWCVSASAYRFLHSLFENHFIGAEEHMIPHCGHYMIPSEDKTSVIISGCSIGIDLDIIHENGEVLIQTEDKRKYSVPFIEYKDAVLAFANQIEDFYHQNSNRNFANEFDQDGFAAFCNEWAALMDRARSLHSTPQAKQIVFDDYDSYCENDIAGVSANGISLKNMKFINFRECAYNFSSINGGSGKCVAERDITGSNPYFAFYTAPKTTHVFFLRKGKICEFFSRKNTEKRFRILKKKIESYGFSTYDLS